MLLIRPTHLDPKPHALRRSNRKSQSTVLNVLEKSTFRMCLGSQRLCILKISYLVVAILSRIHRPFKTADWALSMRKPMSFLSLLATNLEMIFIVELIRLIGR